MNGNGDWEREIGTGNGNVNGNGKRERGMGTEMAIIKKRYLRTNHNLYFVDLTDRKLCVSTKYKL